MVLNGLRSMGHFTGLVVIARFIKLLLAQAILLKRSVFLSLRLAQVKNLQCGMAFDLRHFFADRIYGAIAHITSI
jgi:hypothetical protein